MNIATIGRKWVREQLHLCGYRTAWACIMGTYPTKGYWFHTPEATVQQVNFCRSIGRVGYRKEA
jgi:hypothetical protein